jgi:hypothetical protein
MFRRLLITAVLSAVPVVGVATASLMSPGASPGIAAHASCSVYAAAETRC